MLVSIIIPVYNVKPYLSQCLDSILNQTWKNIQIIIVDDGSDDGSDIICDKYSQQDNRIKVIHTYNEGVGMARNTGLTFVKGEYVIFIDPDDYVSNTMVESLVEIAKKTRADTCIGGYKIVDKNGIIVSEHTPLYEEFEDENVINKCLIRIIGSSPKKKDSIRPMVWNVLYTTDIIKKNGLLFPSEKESIGEDLIFNLQYYLL